MVARWRDSRRQDAHVRQQPRSLSHLCTVPAWCCRRRYGRSQRIGTLTATIDECRHSPTPPRVAAGAVGAARYLNMRSTRPRWPSWLRRIRRADMEGIAARAHTGKAALYRRWPASTIWCTPHWFSRCRRCPSRSRADPPDRTCWPCSAPTVTFCRKDGLPRPAHRPPASP